VQWVVAGIIAVFNEEMERPQFSELVHGPAQALREHGSQPK
jgi:hypothetical protein